MDELISRQAAIDELNAITAITPTQRDVLSDCIEKIEAIPSAQKHGKWFNTSTDIPNLSMNVCSECGFQYPSAIRPRFNYCPNCGAKMDKQEEKK